MEVNKENQTNHKRYASGEAITWRNSYTCDSNQNCGGGEEDAKNSITDSVILCIHVCYQLFTIRLSPPSVTLLSPWRHLCVFYKGFWAFAECFFFYFHCERTTWFKFSLILNQSRSYYRNTLVMLNLLKSTGLSFIVTFAIKKKKLPHGLLPELCLIHTTTPD